VTGLFNKKSSRESEEARIAEESESGVRNEEGRGGAKEERARTNDRTLNSVTMGEGEGSCDWYHVTRFFCHRERSRQSQSQSEIVC
jgi:hypothetical protein